MPALLQASFCYIAPFRNMLLKMLPPFDISKLLMATGCKLTPWEREAHMNILDDIFEDSSHISVMRKIGMEVKIFGFDLGIMEQRLERPGGYLRKFGNQKSLNIFVVATGQVSDDDPTPTLLQDFRAESQRDLVPEHMNMSELAQNYSTETAATINTLSNWILCAPYLSGSLPSAVPGWIPVFASRKDINLRAYISTFNGSNSRLLHMDRPLIRRTFGFDNNNDFLSNIASLVATCIILEKNKRKSKRLRGRLTMNAIGEIYAAAQMDPEERSMKFLIVHGMYPGDTAITLELG